MLRPSRSIGTPIDGSRLRHSRDDRTFEFRVLLHIGKVNGASLGERESHQTPTCPEWDPGSLELSLGTLMIELRPALTAGTRS